MFEFSYSNSTENQTIKPGFFKGLILKSLKHFKLDKQKIIVDMAIVGGGEMKRLNKKYRGKNKPTDVLSFSFDENGLKLSQKNPFLFLGNIVLCLPVIRKAAEKEKISVKEKLTRLTIHGLLHLLGYEHEKSQAERLKMEKLEKILWQKVNTLQD